MRPRAAAFLFIVVLATSVSLRPANAQDDDQESSPLSVTAQFSSVLGADCNSGKGMVGPSLVQGSVVVAKTGESGEHLAQG